MRSVRPLVLVLLSLGVSALAAQQAPTFRGGVQTVPIYATVLDSSGRLVPTLEREHFEVFDNDKPQELTFFRSDVQPITVVVMLDTSGSMILNLDLLKRAAEQFVIRLLPDDRARVGAFSDKLWISPTFTSDRDELIRTIFTDLQFGNGTRLWDAVDASMTALKREYGRRVVLVFTDGADTSSKLSSFDEVLARVLREEFMVYSVGLSSTLPGLPPTRPDSRLRKLADETGGGYYELRHTADLLTTFTRIADELHRQYVLGFTPTQLDGKVHRLDVRVKVPGMTARARKSYVATPLKTSGR